MKIFLNFFKFLLLVVKLVREEGKISIVEVKIIGIIFFWFKCRGK